MKLIRTQIRNYRSIKAIDLNLDPACRVLVGINESGKSNILKALALLDPERTCSPEDSRMESSDEALNTESLVRFVFVMNEEQRAAVLNKVRGMVFEPDIGDPIVGVAAGTEWNLDEFVKRRPQRLYKVDIKTGTRSHTGWAHDASWKVLPGWSRTKEELTVRYEAWSEPQKVPAGMWFRASKYEIISGAEPETVDIIKLNALVIDAGKAIAEAALPKCIYWSYRESDLLPRSISVDAFRAHPETCVPLMNMFALADIPKLQIEKAIVEARATSGNRYRNLLERVGQRTTQYLQRVWQDHSKVSIELRPNGDHIEPIVRDGASTSLGVPMDFENRSDGFKRMATFLLHVSVGVAKDDIENAVILIDEPEIGLHPLGARNLAAELVKLSAKNTVVYSTHSIFMVDRQRIDRHLIVRKSKGFTSIEEAGKSEVMDEEVLYQALGWSFKDVLQANNVIFEGWRDKQLFQAWIKPGDHRKLGIGLTHATGAKDISHLCRQLELAQRNCLVLSDCDAPSLQYKKQHENDNTYGEWRTYRDVLDTKNVETGEDLLTPEAFVERCKLTVQELGLPAPDYAMLCDLPRWPKIVVWLGSCSDSSKERAKELEHILKTKLFDDLTKKEVAPEYEKVYSFVLTHFRDAAA